MKKIVRDNLTAFNLLFLHVQVPDEDGASLSLSLFFFCVFVFGWLSEASEYDDD